MADGSQLCEKHWADHCEKTIKDDLERLRTCERNMMETRMAIQNKIDDFENRKREEFQNNEEDGI